MASRQTTIWSCDRCHKELEQLGAQTGAELMPGNLWFRLGSFEIGQSKRDGVKEYVIMCEDCAKELHLWWNQGAKPCQPAS